MSDFADAFESAGLTWSLFRDFEQALADDPDLSEENPMFSKIKTPGLGEFLVPGSPVSFSAFARSRPEPAPALGMHTEEILGDVVRLSDGEIARLFDAGTVQSPRKMAHKPAA